MSKFDLDKFLKTYKPKKRLEDHLKPYLECEKLKSYELLKKENMKELKPQQTYIKYIKFTNEYKDDDYNSHIRGGLLLQGGIMRGSEFYKKSDQSEWTHLMLKFDPSPIVDKKNRIIERRLDEKYIFFIK
ncbi:MAG: hypothetical protein Satyrvirus24_1, partial [Satyrvirus sp.]